MIDLTPLDVRKKKGDFGKTLRGYDPQEVDHFLDLLAERLEEVVRENMSLREKSGRLEERVQGQDGREKAVQEALITAQALREEIREQARREAELTRREVEAEARGVRADVESFLQARREELHSLNRARDRFLRGMRTLLERELHAVEAEEANPPLTDFDRGSDTASVPEGAPDRDLFGVGSATRGEGRDPGDAAVGGGNG